MPDIRELGDVIAATVAPYQEPQASVRSAAVTTPPASPGAGDRYLVPAGATGVWSTHVGAIAAYDGTAWTYVVPTEGTTTWVDDVDHTVVYDGAAWIVPPVTKAQVGLGNVTDDAQVKADWSGYPVKATPTTADSIIITDAAASGVIKRAAWSGGGSAWSVAANLNPKHWWRADNVVSTGGLVDTLVDAGTGARPFTQTGAARAPIATDGDGKAYLALDGAADFYLAGAAADWTWLHNGSKMWTLFVVMQPPTISAAGTHQSVLATMNYSSSGIGMFVAIGENGGDAAGFPANWYNEVAIYGGGARQSSIWNQSQQDTRKGVLTVRSLAYNSQVAGVDFTSLGAEFQANRQARTLQIWKGDQVVTSSRSPSSGASSYFSQANPAGALRLSGFTDGPRLTGAKIYEILLADRVYSERDTRNYIYYAETKYNLDLSLSV
jgi:hypothetical protein